MFNSEFALVYLVLSIACIQSMELPEHIIKRQVQQKHNNDQNRKVDLPGLFKKLQENDLRMYNFLQDLIHQPIMCAKNVIENTDVHWMAKNRRLLTNMVQYDCLDTEIASVLVSKLGDQQLARYLASVGSITSDVATLIIDDFLTTDINQCLGDFSATYARHFPQEIMSYGNDKVFRKLFMDELTKNILNYQPLSDSRSLEELALVIYCKGQAFKKTFCIKEALGYTIFESQDDQQERHLADFIEELLSAEENSLLRMVLRTTWKNLNDAILLRGVFNAIAEKLEVTRKQLAIDLYVNNVQMMWSPEHAIYKDELALSMINGFRKPFNKMYPS